MRLATLGVGGRTRAAIASGDHWILQDEPDIGALLTDPGWRQRAEAPTGESVAPESATPALLIPQPGKIFCVGLNYRSHILEMGRDLPEYPTLFTKFPEALVGPEDDIDLPAVSTQVDWEAELAVIIGATVRAVPEDQAHQAIAGYSVANDVTVRDWQYRTSQWVQGKTFEATTPLGPELVTGDELGEAADLRLRCEVDGRTVQDSSTADLLFSPAALVAYISTIVTLRPGDVILTGTPGGVGHARDPQEFLHPGAVLTTRIDGIGSCVNRCVGAPELLATSQSRNGAQSQ